MFLTRRGGLSPGREIVQLDIDPAAAFHCATQQQPVAPPGRS